MQSRLMSLISAEAEFLVSSASSQLPSQMLGFCFAAISLMEIYY